MKIAIVSGSHRKDSQSGRVGRHIKAEIARLFPGTSVYFLDLGKTPLPLWDETVWAGGEVWKQQWAPVAAEIQSSDALVAISPEWAGMVPPALKNFLLLCGKAELGHKPGMIVTVSAGRNGAYPVSELRSSGYKNNGLCWIPEHVIVREVAKALQAPGPDGSIPADDDAYVRARMEYTLRVLVEYAKALKSVRDSGVIDNKAYPYGM